MACGSAASGAARTVLGRAVTLNSEPYTIVSVAPPGFQPG